MEQTLVEHSTMPGTGELYIFISCAFQDAQAIRQELARRIFPGLRRITLERGVRMDVDRNVSILSTLPSGTPSPQVPRMLDAIARNRPVFIGIVGDRYLLLRTAGQLATDELTARYPWLTDGAQQLGNLAQIEIIESVLNDPLMEGRSFFYLHDPSPDDCADGFRSPKLDDRLMNLRAMIRESGHPVRSWDDPESLVDLLRRDLLAVFDRFYPLAFANAPIDAERRAHEAFASTRRRAYVEQPDLMARLDAAIESDGPPLVITGPSGAGKSALLANWSARYRIEHPGTTVIEYYAGADTAAVTPSMLLRSVMAEMRERWNITDPLPISDSELRSAFPYWLHHNRDEHIILVIDALDQINAGAEGVGWLPEFFAPHVRLIASTLAGDVLEVLQERGWRVLELPPLSANMRRHLIETLLNETGASLSEGQLEDASAMHASATPLSLRIALTELNVVQADTHRDASLDRYLQTSSVEEMFDLVLERLERNHCRDLVRDVTGLLWASRCGLNVVELQEAGNLRHSELAPLLMELDCYLILRGHLFRFFHDGLRRAVADRYDLRGGVAQRLHRRLANYFSRRPLSERRLHEEPWQLEQAHAWADLKRCVTDPDIFLELSTERYEYELRRYWLLLDKHFDVVEEYHTHLGKLRERHDISHETYVTALERVGHFLLTAGYYYPATELLTQALEFRSNNGGTLTRSYATAAQNLATAYYHCRDYTSAEPLIRKAIDIWTQLEEPNCEWRLRAVNDLGAILFGAENYQEAEEMLRKGMVETENLYSPDHPLILEYLNNLSAVYAAQNWSEQAILTLNRIIKIKQERLGADHPEIAMNMGNLAILLQRKEEYQSAEQLFLEALEILTRCLGRHHAATVRARINLGSLMREMKRFNEAEEHLAEALAIRERVFGPHHAATADALSGLTDLMIESGKYEEAEMHFARLFPLRLSLYDKDDPKVEILDKRYEDLQKLKRSRNDTSRL